MIRRLRNGSAAAVLLLALSTLPGCIIAIGDGAWEDGDWFDENHWGWASDVDFETSHGGHSGHSDTDSVAQLEARIAALEAHAQSCAGCCDDKD